jgi:hypothetical protein
MPDKDAIPRTGNLMAAITQTGQIVHSYLTAIHFIVGNTSRDTKFWQDHLLSYVSQDIIEASGAVMFLAQQGALRGAKRELRFILEPSVKLCYVKQKSYRSSVEDKLRQFDKEFRRRVSR